MAPGKKAVLVLCSFALLLWCAVPAARADFIMTITQVGPNVVGTGSGTIDLSALTFFNNTTAGGVAWGTFPPGGSAIGLGGPISSSPLVDAYSGTLTGSSGTFGSGPEISSDSGSGDVVAITPGRPLPFPEIYVPVGYVSGSTLSNTSTWDNTTIAALGLTPGTYTYDWGSGDSADSFTLIIGASAVPEPSSLVLVASGVLGLAG